MPVYQKPKKSVDFDLARKSRATSRISKQSVVQTTRTSKQSIVQIPAKPLQKGGKKNFRPMSIIDDTGDEESKVKSRNEIKEETFYESAEEVKYKM